MTRSFGPGACLPLERLEALAASRSGLESDRRHVEGCGACRARMDSIGRDNALMGQVGAAMGTPGSAAPSIHGYRILRELQRGGQGVVWLAVQEATKREVAVKTLWGAAATDERQRRRFEREIEIAAGLRHANIVTVYDSLVTANGGLAFAMERVRGVPLTPPTLGGAPLERVLRVFEKACAAVAYAHQRGVIHRDLKPGNILVDAEGEPHVVDFGLAKVMGTPALVDRTLTAEFVGTFAYAAPEQVSGSPDQVDTRTDVYALGVLLYELLTGQRPYPIGGAMSEVVRNITETIPNPPSAIRKGIDSDLDSIVLMALNKERERRYQTAGAMLEDLHRHAAGEAIAARRDSTWYILRKAVGRHRKSAVLAASSMVLLVGFSIVMAAMYQRTLMAERQERDSRLLAEHDRRVTSVVLVEMDDVERRLLVNRPPGLPPKAEAMQLQRQREEVKTKYSDDPETLGAVRTALAARYLRRNLRVEGRSLLLEAKANYELVEVHSATTAHRLLDLGVMLRDCEEYDTAAAVLAPGLAELERIEGPESEGVGQALCDIVILEYKRGNVAAAVQQQDRAVDVLQRVNGGANVDLARLYLFRAEVMAEGDPRGAAGMDRRAIGLLRRCLPPGDPELLAALAVAGRRQLRQGRPGDAEPLLKEAVDGYRIQYPELFPPHLMWVQGDLHNSYLRQGKTEEAKGLNVPPPHPKPRNP